MNIKAVKILLLSLLLALPLSGCGESKQDDAEVQKQFDEFIKNDFISDMENDYLSLHILLEHPENFGVDPKEVKIQIGETFSEENAAQDRKEVAETIESYKAF